MKNNTKVRFAVAIVCLFLIFLPTFTLSALATANPYTYPAVTTTFRATLTGTGRPMYWADIGFNYDFSCYANNATFSTRPQYKGVIGIWINHGNISPYYPANRPGVWCLRWRNANNSSGKIWRFKFDASGNRVNHTLYPVTGNVWIVSEGARP